MNTPLFPQHEQRRVPLATPESSGRFRWFRHLSSCSGLLLLGLLLLISGSFSSCIDRISSSLGLRCESASDCWDNLPCQDKLCGGERLKPDSGSGPESTSTADTSGQDISPSDENTTQCQGNVDALGQCKQDSDCCGKQKCLEVEIEFGGKKNKVNICASCSKDTDCPRTTKCCTSTGFPLGICSILCQAP